MSTSPSQPTPSPSPSPPWKQEVNRRIAAHLNRKGSSAAEPEPLSSAQHCATSRAAAAAARVAARYANAPSYSQPLDGEESAPNSDQTPDQTAIQTASNANLELPTAQTPPIASPFSTDAPAAARQSETQTPGVSEYHIRWQPDLPIRPADPAPLETMREVRTGTAQQSETFAMDHRRTTARPPRSAPREEAIEIVEAAQPIPANLIEFPRELVATRKVRPRLAEGPLAEVPEPGSQLSIFEVDPGAISTQPTVSCILEAAETPTWAAPAEWSGIELDEQPRPEIRPEFSSAILDEPRHVLLEEPDPQTAPASQLQLAPLNRHILSAIVDAILILGATLVAALVAAVNVSDLPPLREIELGSAAALLAVAVLYHLFFFTLAKATPGMRYALICLSTFDGRTPTRAQCLGRFLALPLSLLPLGLGLLWAIFDEQHLCWHDRLSRTYLRRR